MAVVDDDGGTFLAIILLQLCQGLYDGDEADPSGAAGGEREPRQPKVRKVAYANRAAIEDLVRQKYGSTTLQRQSMEQLFPVGISIPASPYVSVRYQHKL